MIEALGVKQPPEGSPSFALVHEYVSQIGPLVHIDFYRIRSAEEIEEAGIPSYFWERNAVVLCEWLSNWSLFERQVVESGRCFRIAFEIIGDLIRDIKIEKN